MWRVSRRDTKADAMGGPREWEGGGEEEGIVATTCGAAQQHKQAQWGVVEIGTYVLLLGHFDGIDGESWWVEKRKRGWIQKKGTVGEAGCCRGVLD